MHLERNFLAEHDKEMDEIISTNDLPQNAEAEKHNEIILNLIKQKEKAYNSQYQFTKDEEAYKKLQSEIYPAAEEAALLQGGNVTLDIDEKKHTAVLEYVCHSLTKIPEDESVKAFLILSLIHSIHFDIDVKEGCLRLCFHFALYEKTLLEDHSALIQEISAKMKSENQRYSQEVVEKAMEAGLDEGAMLDMLLGIRRNMAE